MLFDFDSQSRWNEIKKTLNTHLFVTLTSCYKVKILQTRLSPFRKSCMLLSLQASLNDRICFGGWSISPEWLHWMIVIDSIDIVQGKPSLSLLFPPVCVLLHFSLSTVFFAIHIGCKSIIKGLSKTNINAWTMRKKLDNCGFPGQHQCVGFINLKLMTLQNEPCRMFVPCERFSEVMQKKQCMSLKFVNYFLFISRALALETIPTICYKSVTLCCLAWRSFPPFFGHFSSKQLPWNGVIDSCFDWSQLWIVSEMRRVKHLETTLSFLQRWIILLLCCGYQKLCPVC